jgi:ketopantoate reductase
MKTTQQEEDKGEEDGVVVVGAGAVGCFIGGCLVVQRQARSNNSSVTLVGRPALRAAVERAGLTLCGLGFERGPIRLSPDAAPTILTDLHQVCRLLSFLTSRT